MSNYPDDMFKRTNMRQCPCGQRYHVAIDDPCHIACYGCETAKTPDEFPEDTNLDGDALCIECVADYAEDEDDDADNDEGTTEDLDDAEGFRDV